MDGRGDRSNNFAEGPQLNPYPRLIINGDAPPANPVGNGVLEPIGFLVDVGLVDGFFGGRRQLLQQLTIQQSSSTPANNNVVAMEDNAEVPSEDLTGGSSRGSSEDDEDDEGDHNKIRWWDEFLDSGSSCDSEADFDGSGSIYVDCMEIHPVHDACVKVDCKHFAEKESVLGGYKTKPCEDGEGEHRL